MIAERRFERARRVLCEVARPPDFSRTYDFCSRRIECAQKREKTHLWESLAVAKLPFLFPAKQRIFIRPAW